MIPKELIREIIALNPGAVLGGTAAIMLQGYSVRRDPKDIDIMFEESSRKKFIPAFGMTLISTSEDYDTETEEDLEIRRRVYGYNGHKIDVFLNQKINETCEIDGIECLNYMDILKYKFNYIRGNGAPSEQKHAQDIIFFLEHNIINL